MSVSSLRSTPVRVENSVTTPAKCNTTLHAQPLCALSLQVSSSMHHFLFLQSSCFSSSIPRTIYCRVSGRLEKWDSHQRAAYSIQGRWVTSLSCTTLLFRLSSFSRKVRLAISGRPAKPQHYLHSFHLLVYASPTHRYSLDSRLLATNQVDNLSHSVSIASVLYYSSLYRIL